jgi:hypothetical protein
MGQMCRPASRQVALEVGAELIRIDIQKADFLAVAKQLYECAARSHHLRRELVHFEKTPIEHHDALVAVEHAQALRHVVQGGVEEDVALVELLLRACDLPASRVVGRLGGISKVPQPQRSGAVNQTYGAQDRQKADNAPEHHKPPIELAAQTGKYVVHPAAN